MDYLFGSIAFTGMAVGLVYFWKNVGGRDHDPAEYSPPLDYDL